MFLKINTEKRLCLHWHNVVGKYTSHTNCQATVSVVKVDAGSSIIGENLKVFWAKFSTLS
jgi:hypothetical protein